jgi:hypothetical protein
MRLILRTQALQSKIEGKPPFTENPDDYAVVVDGPAVGRIYSQPWAHMPSARWRWVLQKPQARGGYTATLDEAKAEIIRAYTSTQQTEAPPDAE